MQQHITKNIFSKIKKQQCKVNTNTVSKPHCKSYMNTPAYLNLMFINTTIKGNMKELLNMYRNLNQSQE